MRLNYPAPAISGNGAAITPRPAGSTELVSDEFPVFLPGDRLREDLHARPVTGVSPGGMNYSIGSGH